MENHRLPPSAFARKSLDIPMTEEEEWAKGVFDSVQEHVPGWAVKALRPSIENLVKRLDGQEVNYKNLQLRFGATLDAAVAKVREEMQVSMQETLARIMEEHSKEVKTFDAFQDRQAKELRSMTEALKQEKGGAALIGELLRKEIGGEVSTLVKSYEARLDASETSMQSVWTKGLEDKGREWNKEMADRDKMWQAKFVAMQEAHAKELSEMRQFHATAIADVYVGQKEGFEDLKKFFTSLPQIVVNNQITVPPSEVTVAPAAATVTVNPTWAITENAWQVKVEASMKESVRRKTRKSIVFDEFNRPSTIFEEEVD